MNNTMTSLAGFPGKVSGWILTACWIEQAMRGNGLPPEAELVDHEIADELIEDSMILGSQQKSRNVVEAGL